METATVNIPKDVIEPVIQAHVTAAVSTALGLDGQRLLQEAVSRVLNQKVDENGKQSNYTHSGSPSFIQWVMQDCVKKAVRQAIEDEMPKHQDAIRQSVIRMLQQKNSPLVKQFVEALVTGVTSGLKYRITVDVAT